MTQAGDLLHSFRGFDLALVGRCSYCGGSGRMPRPGNMTLQGSYGGSQLTQVPPDNIPCSSCANGVVFRIMTVEELMTLLAAASERAIVGTK